jgi:hypothetical protein
MRRSDIREELKTRFGNKCSICGAEDVPLYVDHIVPISRGGSDNIENLRLVCLRCNLANVNGLRGFEFEDYLFRLLRLNKNFRNIETQVKFGRGTSFVADLVAEERTEDHWSKKVIECKVDSSFTSERLSIILGQLNTYRKFIGRTRLVLAFPGELNQNDYELITRSNIEIWDLAYLSNTFKKEIARVYHPILQDMLTTQTRMKIPLERSLIQELKGTRPGWANNSKYQKLVGRILERLFCPPLQTPIPEHSDSLRLNRRDFILPNYSEDGFWAFMRTEYSGDFIVVDAKNYSGKIKKPCVLQISNYLKKHGLGLFGMIICRNGEDRNSSQTLREIWAIERKLVIILTDNDVEKMLIEKSAGRSPEVILRQKIEDFRLAL